MIGLLYSNVFHRCKGLSADFVQTFKWKLSSYVDEPTILIEWAIGSFLDVRQ